MFPISRLKGIVKDKRGFTLMEFSLVIAIIGIILGVVMVGAETIRSARVKRLGSDLQTYNSAAYTYFNRKGKLPGDIDSNGIIDDSKVFFNEMERENITIRNSNPYGGLYEAGNSTSLNNIGNYVRTQDIVPVEVAKALDDQLDDGLVDMKPGNDSGRLSGNIRYDATSGNVRVYIRL